MKKLARPILTTALVLMCLLPVHAADLSLTQDGKIPGTPFQALQAQIDELRVAIENIQLIEGPPGPPGVPGPNGISVTTEKLPIGDENCSNGGIKIVSSNDVTYLCNNKITQFENLANSPCFVDGLEGRIGITYSENNTADLQCNLILHKLTVELIAETVGDFSCGTEQYQCGTDICHHESCYIGAFGRRHCNYYEYECPIYCTKDVICNGPMQATVVSNPAGIDASAGGSSDQTRVVAEFLYPKNSEVELLSVSSIFSQDCSGMDRCKVVIDGDKHIVVTH